jgi:hypothetical protein
VSVIKRGVIQSYDPAAHKAVVQIAGSLAVFLPGLRVATNIPAADVVPGRQATVLLLDPSNPDDAVIVAVQGALPSGGGGGDTGIFLLLAGRAGGQAASGGVDASENLTLESTSHATKGEVQVVDGSPFGARKMYGNYVGQAGGDANTMLRIRNQSAAESVSLSKWGLTIDPSWAPSADSQSFYGISGNALISNAGRIGTRAFGLDFVALAWQGTFVDLVGASVRPQKYGSQATTITAFEGFRAQPSIGANATITNYASFRSFTAGNSGMATAIGLKIDDITLGTTKVLIEAGPATPNLRVEATTPTSGGGLYEDSRVMVAFRDNAGVVTLRRLHTLPFSSCVAATKVVVAI